MMRAERKVMHMTSILSNSCDFNAPTSRKSTRLAKFNWGKCHLVQLWESSQASIIVGASTQKLRRQLDAYVQDGDRRPQH